MALEFSRWHRMTEVGIWVDNKFPWTFLLQGCRHVPQPHALTSGYCREEDKVLWASTSSFLCLQCHKIQDGLQASPDQETKLTLVSLSLSKENYRFDPSISSFRKEEIPLVSVLSIISPCDNLKWPSVNLVSITWIFHSRLPSAKSHRSSWEPCSTQTSCKWEWSQGRTARAAAQEPQHHVGTLLAGDCEHTKHNPGTPRCQYQASAREQQHPQSYTKH